MYNNLICPYILNNIIINGIKYSPKDENLIVRLYKKGYKNSKKIIR